MSHSLYLLFPLFSAILYAFGIIPIKRAVDLGFGIWRTTFGCNIVYAVFFLPLLFLGGTFHAELLWQPAVVAALFIAGQSFTIISLHGGDVSLATPVLGLKILLVAFFTSLLLPGGVHAAHWIAAALSVAAIALLSRKGSAQKHHGVARTVITAALAALTFALFDVLVMKWSPHWGAGRFLPVMFGLSALMSFVMIPAFGSSGVKTAAIPHEAWRWLLTGSALIALQSVFFVGAIAVFGNGTSANVVYSTRGLWSVVLVFYTGHWFNNTEHQSGRALFRTRLAGAALMTLSVTIVFVV